MVIRSHRGTQTFNTATNLSMSMSMSMPDGNTAAILLHQHPISAANAVTH